MFLYIFIFEYHAELFYMFRPARDHHQGIKPKQNRIKQNYPLSYTADVVQRSQIVKMQIFLCRIVVQTCCVKLFCRGRRPAIPVASEIYTYIYIYIYIFKLSTTCFVAQISLPQFSIFEQPCPASYCSHINTLITINGLNSSVNFNWRKFSAVKNSITARCLNRTSKNSSISMCIG